MGRGEETLEVGEMRSNGDEEGVGHPDGMTTSLLRIAQSSGSPVSGSFYSSFWLRWLRSSGGYLCI
jgi:hypothetical protein